MPNALARESYSRQSPIARASGYKSVGLAQELIALADGHRESPESWADLPRDCKRRGMTASVLAARWHAYLAMESDEGVGLFVLIFAVMTALPFVMAWVEQTMDGPRPSGLQRWWPRRPR